MQAQSTESSGDLIVRGGTLVDGTGAERRRADVRVRNGLVAEIGPDLAKDGETELDASNAFVAPGLIESHTHFDPSLWWDPACDPMPQHGVTSILFGNCSLSLAPVRAADRAGLSQTFAVIEEIPELGFSEYIPWDWESYPEYIDSMRSRGFGVNVAGLVGLSALRLYVIGAEAWERPSTPKEREQIVALLDDALRHGASGFSGSFFDRGADGRLVPAAQADDAELSALLQVTGKHGGHFEMLSQMMDQPTSLEQLERCSRMAGAAGVVMTWNGFQDWDRDSTIIETYVDLARRLQSEGLPTYPTLSPHPQEFLANFQGGMGFLAVPAWNELLQAEEPEQAKMLADPAWRARASADWDKYPKTTFPHQDLDRVRIETVERADLEHLVGESFGDWARQHGGHNSDALADWLQLNDLHPGLAYVTANADPDRLASFLKDPAVMIGASDAGAHCISHCNSGDTTLFLSRYVRDRGDFTLEEGIAQLTSRQADLYGFADIGRLQVGKRADLIVFELDKLNFARPEAVYDFPGNTKRYRRPAGGYRATAVGGVMTQIDGKETGALPGQWLTGQSPVRP